jgi:hypothetical protein
MMLLLLILFGIEMHYDTLYCLLLFSVFFIWRKFLQK